MRALLCAASVLCACATAKSQPVGYYPAEARALELEGDVELMITVDEHGDVTHVEIVRGPGHGLNEAARDNVRHQKFKPAIREGKPVPYTLPYTYKFRLD